MIYCGAGILKLKDILIIKLREAGLLMTGNTCRQIVVSTLVEAQFYLDNGFNDITYAYPLSPDKLPRCAELLNRLTLFHVTVDNMTIIEALGNYVLPESSKWSVLLLVDCGYGRGIVVGQLS